MELRGSFILGLFLLGTTNGGYEYVEIAHLLDIDDGVFSPSVITTGLENEDDITANTYSIIGDLDLRYYRDSEGYYTFSLVYDIIYNIPCDDCMDVELRWSQTSWITDGIARGYKSEETWRALWWNGLGVSRFPNKTWLDGGTEPGRVCVGQLWLCSWPDYWNSVCPVKLDDRGIHAMEDSYARSFTLSIKKAWAALDEPAGEVEIAHYLDVAMVPSFRTTVISTGVSDSGDITENTYSIIGILKTSDYLDSDGYYTFRLVYNNEDGTTSNIKWKQTSWLTAETITGFEAISVSQPNAAQSGDDNQMFKGLRKSQTDKCYLDSGSSGDVWWNSINPVKVFWPFPAFDGKYATGFHLYAVKVTGDPAVTDPSDTEMEQPQGSTMESVPDWYGGIGFGQPNSIF